MRAMAKTGAFLVGVTVAFGLSACGSGNVKEGSYELTSVEENGKNKPVSDKGPHGEFVVEKDNKCHLKLTATNSSGKSKETNNACSIKDDQVSFEDGSGAKLEKTDAGLTLRDDDNFTMNFSGSGK